MSSSSMLKKSLELFKTDLGISSHISHVKRPSQGKGSGAAQHPVKSGGHNDYGPKKKVKMRKIGKEKQPLRKLKKSLTKDIAKYTSKDYTEDNIYYIKQLLELDQVAHSLNDSKMASAIMNHQKGKLAKNSQDVSTYNLEKEDSTVFTEEDFKNFTGT